MDLPQNDTDINNDIVTWARFPYCRPFVMEIHWLLMNTLHKWSYDVAFAVWLNKLGKKTVQLPVIGEVMMLMWRHCELQRYTIMHGDAHQPTMNYNEPGRCATETQLTTTKKKRARRGWMNCHKLLKSCDISRNQTTSPTCFDLHWDIFEIIINWYKRHWKTCPDKAILGLNWEIHKL